MTATFCRELSHRIGFDRLGGRGLVLLLPEREEYILGGITSRDGSVGREALLGSWGASVQTRPSGCVYRLAFTEQGNTI